MKDQATTSCVIGCVPTSKRYAVTSSPNHVLHSTVVSEATTEATDATTNRTVVATPDLCNGLPDLRVDGEHGWPSSTLNRDSSGGNMVANSTSDVDLYQPHLVHLNNDRRASGSDASKLLSPSGTAYRLRRGKSTFGSARSSLAVDIALHGPGVDDYHGYFLVDDSRTTLYPLAVLTFIDGVRISQPTVLQHGCLLLIGHTNHFRFYTGSQHLNPVKSFASDFIATGAQKSSSDSSSSSSNVTSSSKGSKSKFRDHLERAQFVEKLAKFENLAGPARLDATTSTVVSRHRMSPSRHGTVLGRPNSAPSDNLVQVYNGLRHMGHNSLPTSKKGKSESPHFIETPTGDLTFCETFGLNVATTGLNHSGSKALHPTDSEYGVHAMEDGPRDSMSVRSSAVNSGHETAICLTGSLIKTDGQQDKSTDKSKPTRHRKRRDRMTDIKAAILASAAAKLAEDASQIDSTLLVSCNTKRFSDPVPVSGLVNENSPPDSCVTETVRADSYSNVQSAISSESKASNDPKVEQPSVSVNPQEILVVNGAKPPTGRAGFDQNRYGKGSNQQNDRKGLDSPGSFFRSLLHKAQRSPSPNRPVKRQPCLGSDSSSQTAVLSSMISQVSPDSSDQSNSNPWEMKKVTDTTDILDGDKLDNVNPPLTVTKTSVASMNGSQNSVADHDQNTSSAGLNVVNCDTPISATNNDTTGADGGPFHGEKVFTRDTVTTNVVLPAIGRYWDSSSPLTEAAETELEKLATSVVCSLTPVSTSGRSFTSWNASPSPDRNRRNKKSVTFSNVTDFCKDLSKNNNSDWDVELMAQLDAAVGQLNYGTSQNNNSSLPIAAEAVLSHPESNDVPSLTNNSTTDFTANTNSCNKNAFSRQLTTTQDVYLNLNASSATVKPLDVENSSVPDEVASSSCRLSTENPTIDDCTDTLPVVLLDNVTVAKQNDVSFSSQCFTVSNCDVTPSRAGDDDLLSVISTDDVDNDDLTSSQRDLRLLYRQRRTERLQEQEAAALERRRLEEILRLCTEFGRQAELAAPTNGPSAAAAADESYGRKPIVSLTKTSDSLKKLPSPNDRLQSVVDSLPSNSDDDDDDSAKGGTIKRRPQVQTSDKSRMENAVSGPFAGERSGSTRCSRRTAGSMQQLNDDAVTTNSIGSFRDCSNRTTVGAATNDAARPDVCLSTVSTGRGQGRWSSIERVHHWQHDSASESQLSDRNSTLRSHLPDSSLPVTSSDNRWRNCRQKVLDLRLHVEMMRSLRSDMVQKIANTKQKILEIETQQIEALRELEMERALLEAEQQIQLEQLDTVKEKVTDLESKQTKLLAEAAAERAQLLNNIQHEKQHLDVLERRHSETAKEMESCTDESKTVFLRRSNQEHQDAVDNQRFLVENLEFQQLEDESHYEEEKEIIQRQLKIEREELLGKCDLYKATLEQITEQQSQLVHQVDSSISDLEEERNLLAEQLKKESLTIGRIDQQIVELSSLLPEYSIDGYGTYVDDDDDDDDVTIEPFKSDDFDQMTQQLPADLQSHQSTPNLFPVAGSQAFQRSKADNDAQRCLKGSRMRFPSMKNWDPSQNEQSTGERFSADPWTSTGRSELEDLIQSGSGLLLDRIPLREQQHMKTCSAEQLLMLAQAEKIRMLAEKTKEQKREADRRALEQERKRRNELECRLIDEMRKHNEIMEQAIRLRDKPKTESRPLTRYLPIRNAQLNLQQFITSAGHNIDLAAAHIILTGTTCRGYLAKLGGRLRAWKRRWFVFDRSARTLCYYYSDKMETKPPPRGIIYFQAIEDVFVDHMGRARSPTPQLTFCVKTTDRAVYLVAPTASAMRIWVDVIFTGAEGYREFA